MSVRSFTQIVEDHERRIAAARQTVANEAPAFRLDMDELQARALASLIGSLHASERERFGFGEFTRAVQHKHQVPAPIFHDDSGIPFVYIPL